MPVPTKRAIARAYLPSRYHFGYALTKLATDPLYRLVSGLFPAHEPLLDVGCGIGLLAQYLAAAGAHTAGYRGVDIDAAKIAIANAAAQRSSLPLTRFEVCDLTRELPAHRGSVAVLDVLQYLEPTARDRLVACVAECVSPSGHLVMRVGLDDGGWRARWTRITDRWGHQLRWMQTPPRSQPTQAHLADLLASAGLRCEFRPAWGATPFNNWIVVGRRA
jgi:SAM-dependent methyltransferase